MVDILPSAISTSNFSALVNRCITHNHYRAVVYCTSSENLEAVFRAVCRSTRLEKMAAVVGIYKYDCSGNRDVIFNNGSLIRFEKYISGSVRECYHGTLLSYSLRCSALTREVDVVINEISYEQDKMFWDDGDNNDEVESFLSSFIIMN